MTVVEATFQLLFTAGAHGGALRRPPITVATSPGPLDEGQFSHSPESVERRLRDAPDWENAFHVSCDNVLRELPQCFVSKR